MSWIKVIDYDESDGQLRKMYDRIKGPNGQLDNVLTIHSLRPHSLVGHMGLYKNVLHNSNNTLPKWYLELLGVYTSHTNKCGYCVDHHFAGLKRLINDEDKSNSMMKAVVSEDFSEVLSDGMLAAISYVNLLITRPHDLKSSHVEQLKSAGLGDGQILEINQVVSYFCYVNRTVLGLGVSVDGEVLGLSPNNSSEAEDWGHS